MSEQMPPIELGRLKATHKWRRSRMGDWERGRGSESAGCAGSWYHTGELSVVETSRLSQYPKPRSPSLKCGVRPMSQPNRTRRGRVVANRVLRSVGRALQAAGSRVDRAEDRRRGRRRGGKV